MIEDVHITQYGAPASRALATAIQKAQASGPLAPVTVIVGSNFAGLAARRLLGSTIGVVNVGFLTPFRLAELLGADRLLDRHPLTNPSLGAAVRRVLADDPGPFRGVRDHVATETALAALYAELSNTTPEARERLAGSGSSAALTALRFHEAIAGHLVEFHDEADLARAAAERTDLSEALRPFGTLVWYLPEPLTAPLAQLLRAVLGLAPARVIVGVCGDDDADDATWTLLSDAGVERPPGAPAVPMAHADSIVSVTDADEEVRAVIRRIVELADRGVRLDRIGVFHPVPDPYIAILEQQFDTAGIPANGPSRRRLKDTVAGRTLLAALSLPQQRWRRDRVMALVAGGPVVHDGALARPTAMERTSREAGVVQDLSDWRRKLAARRTALETRLSELSGPTDPATDRYLRALERDRGDVDALGSFVDQLADAIGSVERAAGWSARSEAAGALLHRLLGPGNSHHFWPEAEQAAFERVEDALARLAALEHLEPGASHEVFVRALSAELDVPLGRNGRFGEGVMYGPISAAVGHDLEAVFVLGCTEGRCPSVRRDDAMLPDSVREHAGGELTLRSAQLHDQHRRFLAALASAPEGGRTLLFPRGDLRSSKESLPSRWLLDTASALHGSTVHSTEFAEAPLNEVDLVHSHLHGITSAPVHGSVLERDQAAVLEHLAHSGSAPDHPTASRARRGLLAQAARRSDRFTEWDGNLAGQPIPSTDRRPLSPTRLETWAGCGFRYFLGQVLELGDRDDPERVLDLSPLDRGTAMHRALELFLAEVIAAGPPEPGRPWSPEERSRLRQLAEAELDALESRGRAGRQIHWRLSRTDVLATLEGFLDADAEYRATRRASPQRVELPFGLEDADPVTLELADGRTLAFRGKADRVDVGADGHMTVLDYKTGKRPYEGLDEDPVRGGTTLQLGLYAEAARQQLGATEVDAYYWLVNDAAGFQRNGYRWDDDRRARLLEVVTAIADGIEGGIFPALPGEWDNFRRTNENCVYCEFDSVCPTDRGEHAEAKSGAPELRIRSALAPPEPSEASVSEEPA